MISKTYSIYSCWYFVLTESSKNTIHSHLNTLCMCINEPKWKQNQKQNKKKKHGKQNRSNMEIIYIYNIRHSITSPATTKQTWWIKWCHCWSRRAHTIKSMCEQWVRKSKNLLVQLFLLIKSNKQTNKHLECSS